MEINKKLSSIANYKLTGKIIGEGAFAKVEIATHNVFNKKVALKITTINKKLDPYMIKNLKRESQILSKLNHPNIVQLFEICYGSGFYCLALQYLEGGNLCDLLINQSDSRLSENMTRNISQQLTLALSYLHSKGILHRDLKLENIVLNKNYDQVVIVDFGLSNFYKNGMKLNTYCGSPEYAAPELFEKDKPYGFGVDVWSFGVLVFAMLTGTLPFQLDTSLSKLISEVKEGFIDKHLKQLNHINLSKDAKNLISRMLCVDKEKRITLSEISHHCWITDGGKINLVQESEVRFTEQQELDIASTLKEKLDLKNHTPSAILQYVKSKQGRFGKTAGCYNILSQEMREKDRENANKNDMIVAVVNKEVFDNKRVEEIDINYTKQNNKNPNTKLNFWDSTQGQIATNALPKHVSNNSENYTKIRSKDDAKKINKCVGSNLTKGHSSKAWRRNIKPSHKRGEMPARLSRLERMDNGQQLDTKHPLQDRDINILNNCNGVTNSQPSKMIVETGKHTSASKNFHNKKHQQDMGHLALRLR